MKKVQNFDEFTSSKVNENILGDFFSGTTNFLGNFFTKGWGAFTDVLKNKVTAYLLQYLGIGENTILSQLVQQMVEQFDVKDYWAILFNGKADAKYLAPKAAKATQEFLIKEGLDGIAEKLGVTDKNGYLFKTISEYIQNETTTGNFPKTLENFYLQLFGSAPTNSAKDFVDKLSPSEKSKIKTEVVTKAKSQGVEVKTREEEDNMVNNLFSNLGSLNQSNQGQISTTSGEDLFGKLIGPSLPKK